MTDIHPYDVYVIIRCGIPCNELGTEIEQIQCVDGVFPAERTLLELGGVKFRVSTSAPSHAERLIAQSKEIPALERRK